MVVDSPAGARIITTALQIIPNVIDHKMPINEAASAPRVLYAVAARRTARGTDERPQW